MRTLGFFSVLSTVTLACFVSACDGGGDGTGGNGGNGGSGGSGGTGGTGGSQPECGNGTVEGDEQCDDGAANSDTAACKTDCTPATCGDSLVGPNEECDEGAANGDTAACTSACKSAACGDGLTQAGVEDCDDGAENADTAACTSTCKSAACGDGLTQAGVEDCDDGAANDDTAACTSTCKTAACGDGLTQAGVEECDDGAANADTAACTSTCKSAVCGDSLTQAGVEGCDDGDMVDDDECTNACTLPACGDGIEQAGEGCDLGAANSDSGACTSLCNKAVCGDTLLQSGVEECDDGAANSNTAACTLACQAAACGDGFTQAGVEECDDGAANSNTAACTLMCAAAKCGDGFVRAGVEPCDDGNMTNGDGCNNDCVVSGTPIWTQTFSGAANLVDTWNAVATDAMGNIYVTGAEGTAAGYNVVTRKYNAAGAVQWTQQYNGIGNGNDEGQGIAVDAAGNVYVTGYAQVSATDIDVLVAKYNGANGAVLWTNTIPGGVANGVDVGTGIAVNPANGNVYASGYAVTQPGVGSDLIVAKINPANGQLVWFDFLNGAGNQDDFANGIAVDSSGAVVATGGVRSAANYDIWVRKYTDAGATFSVVWTRTFNGLSNADDAGYAATADGAGNVLVAGTETVNGQSNNVWVRKYDAAGNTVWTQTYAGASSLNDRGYGIRADAAGNAVVCGFEAIANTTADVWVRKYSPAGAALWTQTYNGNADQDDVGNGCALDPSGNVLVAGYETVTGPNTNGWLRKYAP